MPNPSKNPDSIADLLDRLSKVTDQITQASEKQAREAELQLKRLLDHGEASTQRLLKAVDKEIQAQIVSLRREIRDVERRVREMRRAGVEAVASRRSPAKKAAAKKTAKKRPAARKPVKKAAKKPAKKTAANKTVARKVAKKAPTKKAASKRAAKATAG